MFHSKSTWHCNTISSSQKVNAIILLTPALLLRQGHIGRRTLDSQGIFTIRDAFLFWVSPCPSQWQPWGAICYISSLVFPCCSPPSVSHYPRITVSCIGWRRSEDKSLPLCAIRLGCTNLYLFSCSERVREAFVWQNLGVCFALPTLIRWGWQKFLNWWSKANKYAWCCKIWNTFRVRIFSYCIIYLLKQCKLYSFY